MLRNKKERLNIKNTVTELKDAIDRLISRLYIDIARTRVSELKCEPIETTQTEMQRDKRVEKKDNRTSKNIQQFQKM